ncbi:MAG: hypothetical protein GX038_03545 [Erysipelothrix sp.]|nr:hypothetical protein [Erysipelothrix sp.]
MNKNKRFLIPLLTGSVIALSLYYAILVKRDSAEDLNIGLRYVAVGFVGFIYSYVLGIFNMNRTAKIFLVLSIVSGLYLYFAMPLQPGGFLDLGVILTWLMLMGASIILPLLGEGIYYFIQKKNR